MWSHRFVSCASIVFGCTLFGWSSANAQICAPSSDGSTCAPLACSAIPEDQCLADALHIDWATGAITVDGCTCRDFNTCHIIFGNATPFPDGYCPNDEVCKVFAEDTDNDGKPDWFTARCTPVHVGACCLDIDDGPIPYDTCLTLDEASCNEKGGVFHGVNTGCTATLACCLGATGAIGCYDMNPHCCLLSGGVPLGPGSTCDATDPASGCGPICGGIAGIPCPDETQFCRLPDGHCCCDYLGVCIPRPEVCPLVLDPVCGCDGETYGNECEALAAGVSIDHHGPCTHPCTSNENCDASFEFCRFPIGSCGASAAAPGVCIPRPTGCYDLWAPVCGCDGMTYANDCEAYAAGVSIAHEGACEHACTSDADCDANIEFCKFPTGSCGQTNVGGVCTPRPTGCPDVWDPVCGCDGMTYSNECDAFAKGVSVRHEGPCEDVGACCTDMGGSPLPVPVCTMTPPDVCESATGGFFKGPGTFCEPPQACCLVLGGSVVGVCVETDPFCCLAFGGIPLGPGSHCSNSNGTNACGPLCGGIAGIPCDDPETYCRLPDGHCCCDFFGVCVPTPEGCPDVWAPVCGCDGVTYGNDCEAAAVGVSIDHRGPCERVCGGFAGDTCDDGEFCKFPIGVCNDAVDQTGVCTPIPEACPDVWDPVCGCDGQTYGNECEADAAAVSIAHEGPCERVCGGLGPYPPCDSNEFCKFPPGTCDDPTVLGVCAEFPANCPEYYYPVCGCDGETYDNECFAYSAGVSIDHFGACMPEPCSARRVFEPNDVAANPTYCPGMRKRVHILLGPPAATTSIGIEDSPPTGWTVSNISHGGTYDATNHKVKWGPMFPPFPIEVNYEALPAIDSDVTPACFSGEISLDGLNEPICGPDCLSPRCPPFLPADLPQPPCAACPIGDCRSCDDGCQNGRIRLCELVGYACAWKTGCNDELAGMTRAAYIWRTGECYCWREAEQNWFPTTCPPPASGICSNTSEAVGLGDGSSPQLPDEMVGAAARIEQVAGRRDRKVNERTFTARIKAPDGATSMAMDVEVPLGWALAKASDGGKWDSINRKIKWGPYFENLSRTIAFTLRRGTDRRVDDSLRPDDKPRLDSLEGTVSFDGVNHAIRIR